MLPTDPSPESSYDDEEIAAPDQGLDDLWGSLRQKKAKKMAKDRSKVQSLEERDSTELDLPPVVAPRSFDNEDSLKSIPKQAVKRQKSVYVADQLCLHDA